MQYPLDLEKIRGVLPESYEKFWDTLMGVVISLVDLHMEKTVGSKKEKNRGLWSIHGRGQAKP